MQKTFVEETLHYLWGVRRFSFDERWNVPGGSEILEESRVVIFSHGINPNFPNPYIMIPFFPKRLLTFRLFYLINSLAWSSSVLSCPSTEIEIFFVYYQIGLLAFY